MTREGEPDPYTQSGSYAAASAGLRRREESLASSLRDADKLEDQGHKVIARARRNFRAGVGVLVLTGLLAAWLVFQIGRPAASRLEGAVRGNWCLLGSVLAMAGMYLELAWIGGQRRLRETGLRLIRRAEYQRRLAALQLKEVQDEAVR